MNKIKKQFKDFWQYFRLVRFGQNTTESMKRFRKCLPALIIIIAGVVVTLSQMDIGFTFFSGAFVGAAMGLGICTAVKPTALSVAPFSPKQRMVFSVLSALLMAIIISLIYLAIMILFILIVALIAFCVDGENLLAYEAGSGLSAYGSAFTLLTITLFCILTYAIFHLERRRNITITSIVFVALMEVFSVIMTNVCYNSAGYEASFRFTMAAPVPELITQLYAPWVVIVVLGVLNVAAIAAAVFMIIRRFKSDKV